MTHTLHRRGTAENLSNDYVVFAIAAQTVNAKGISSEFSHFMDLALKYNPVCYGDMKTGNKYGVGLEKIASEYRDNSIVHAVYTDKNSVIGLLKDLSTAGLKVSIVVSGLLEQTAACCHEAGISPHTVEYSMGIWGKTELLPEEEVLQVSTMCGHGMLSFSLVEHLVDSVKKGKMTSEQAGEKLASLCHCGVFNPTRASEIISGMAEK